MNEEDNEDLQEMKESLAAPAVSGYDAFIGVDPEYRDANRNASLTQGELDTLHNAGLKTDAETHRENQLAVVEDWNDANVVLDDAPDDETDDDESSEKPAEKPADEDLSAPLL